MLLLLFVKKNPVPAANPDVHKFLFVKALQNAKQGRKNLVLSLPYLCSTIPHRYEKQEGYNWLNVALLFGMTKNPMDMTSHFVMGSKLKV